MESKARRVACVGGLCKKKGHPCKKKDTFREVCPAGGLGIWPAYHMGTSCRRTWYSVISRNWTSISLICVEFLDSVSESSNAKIIFRVLIFGLKSLWKSKLYTFPGRKLLIRWKKSKGKYQNDSLTSLDAQKKLDRKSHSL